MLKWIALFFENLLGNGLARVLGGAGLSLATGALALPLITGGLNAISAAFGGIPADILNVALLFGFGEALSIMGTAMLTRAGMAATKVGIRKAAR